MTFRRNRSTSTISTWCRSITAVLAVVALAGSLAVVGAVAVAASSKGHVYKIIDPGSNGNKIRIREWSGPSNSTHIEGTLTIGINVSVTCETTGPRIHKSAVWDRLKNGWFIQNYYTTAPNKKGFTPSVLRCSAAQLLPTTTTSTTTTTTTTIPAVTTTTNTTTTTTTIPAVTTYPFSIVLSGASLYSGPGSEYSDLGSIGNGTALAIVCQAKGTSTGSTDPTVWWDLLKNAQWVSDYYTNTPVVDGPSPPIPQCSSSLIPTPPSSPGTVTTYPFNIVLSGASLYSGPGSEYSDLGGIGNGTALAIVCQAKGTSTGSTDPTVWWDLLNSSDWVSDYYTNTPVVDGPSPPIPQCSSSLIPAPPVTSPSALGASIVSIAKSQNGVLQTSATCAAAYGCTGNGEWCALFVIWVWNHAGAQTGGLTAAADSFSEGSSSTYTWYPDQGTSNVPAAGFTPQPGDAIVWARDGVVQHVGIVNTYGGSMGSDYSINGNWQMPNSNPDLYTSWEVNVDIYPDLDITAQNAAWYVYGYAVPKA